MSINTPPQGIRTAHFGSPNPNPRVNKLADLAKAKDLKLGQLTTPGTAFDDVRWQNERRALNAKYETAEHSAYSTPFADCVGEPPSEGAMNVALMENGIFYSAKVHQNPTSGGRLEYHMSGEEGWNNIYVTNADPAITETPTIIHLRALNDPNLRAGQLEVAANQYMEAMGPEAKGSAIRCYIKNDQLIVDTIGEEYKVHIFSRDGTHKGTADSAREMKKKAPYLPGALGKGIGQKATLQEGDVVVSVSSHITPKDISKALQESGGNLHVITGKLLAKNGNFSRDGQIQNNLNKPLNLQIYVHKPESATNALDESFLDAAASATTQTRSRLRSALSGLAMPNGLTSRPTELDEVPQKVADGDIERLPPASQVRGARTLHEQAVNKDHPTEEPPLSPEEYILNPLLKLSNIPEYISHRAKDYFAFKKEKGVVGVIKNTGRFVVQVIGEGAAILTTPAALLYTASTPVAFAAKTGLKLVAGVGGLFGAVFGGENAKEERKQELENTFLGTLSPDAQAAYDGLDDQGKRNLLRALADKNKEAYRAQVQGNFTHIKPHLVDATEFDTERTGDKLASVLRWLPGVKQLLTREITKTSATGAPERDTHGNIIKKYRFQWTPSIAHALVDLIKETDALVTPLRVIMKVDQGKAVCVLGQEKTNRTVEQIAEQYALEMATTKEKNASKSNEKIKFIHDMIIRKGHAVEKTIEKYYLDNHLTTTTSTPLQNDIKTRIRGPIEEYIKVLHTKPNDPTRAAALKKFETECKNIEAHIRGYLRGDIALENQFTNLLLTYRSAVEKIHTSRNRNADAFSRREVVGRGIEALENTGLPAIAGLIKQRAVLSFIKSAVGTLTMSNGLMVGAAAFGTQLGRRISEARVHEGVRNVLLVQGKASTDQLWPIIRNNKKFLGAPMPAECATDDKNFEKWLSSVLSSVTDAYGVKRIADELYNLVEPQLNSYRDGSDEHKQIKAVATLLSTLTGEVQSNATAVKEDFLGTMNTRTEGSEVIDHLHKRLIGLNMHLESGEIEALRNERVAKRPGIKAYFLKNILERGVGGGVKQIATKEFWRDVAGSWIFMGPMMLADQWAMHQVVEKADHLFGRSPGSTISFNSLMHVSEAPVSVVGGITGSIASRVVGHSASVDRAADRPNNNPATRPIVNVIDFARTLAARVTGRTSTDTTAQRTTEPVRAQRTTEPAPAPRAVEPAPAPRAAEPAPAPRAVEPAPVPRAAEPAPAPRSAEPAPAPSEAPASAPLSSAVIAGLQAAFPGVERTIERADSARGREGILINQVDSANVRGTDVFSAQRAGVIAHILERQARTELGHTRIGDVQGFSVDGNEFIIRRTRDSVTTEARIPISDVIAQTGLTAAEVQALTSGREEAAIARQGGRTRAQSTAPATPAPTPAPGAPEAPSVPRAERPAGTRTPSRESRSTDTTRPAPATPELAPTPTPADTAPVPPSPTPSEIREVESGQVVRIPVNHLTPGDNGQVMAVVRGLQRELASANINNLSVRRGREPDTIVVGIGNNREATVTLRNHADRADNTLFASNVQISQLDNGDSNTRYTRPAEIQNRPLSEVLGYLDRDHIAPLYRATTVIEREVGQMEDGPTAPVLRQRTGRGSTAEAISSRIAQRTLTESSVQRWATETVEQDSRDLGLGLRRAVQRIHNVNIPADRIQTAIMDSVRAGNITYSNGQMRFTQPIQIGENVTISGTIIPGSEADSTQSLYRITMTRGTVSRTEPALGSVPRGEFARNLLANRPETSATANNTNQGPTRSLTPAAEAPLPQAPAAPAVAESPQAPVAPETAPSAPEGTPDRWDVRSFTADRVVDNDTRDRITEQLTAGLRNQYGRNNRFSITRTNRPGVITLHYRTENADNQVNIMIGRNTSTENNSNVAHDDFDAIVVEGARQGSVFARTQNARGTLPEVITTLIGDAMTYSRNNRQAVKNSLEEAMNNSTPTNARTSRAAAPETTTRNEPAARTAAVASTQNETPVRQVAERTTPSTAPRAPLMDIPANTSPDDLIFPEDRVPRTIAQRLSGAELDQTRSSAARSINENNTVLQARPSGAAGSLVLADRTHPHNFVTVRIDGVDSSNNIIAHVVGTGHNNIGRGPRLLSDIVDETERTFNPNATVATRTLIRNVTLAAHGERTTTAQPTTAPSQAFIPVSAIDDEVPPDQVQAVLNRRLNQVYRNEPVGRLMDAVRTDIFDIQLEGQHDPVVALRMMDGGYRELHREAQALAAYLHGLRPTSTRLAAARNLSVDDIESAVARSLDRGKDISARELAERLDIPVDTRDLNENPVITQNIVNRLYNIAGYAGGLRMPEGLTTARVEEAIREGENRLNERISNPRNAFDNAQGRGRVAVEAMYNRIADVNHDNRISLPRSTDSVDPEIMTRVAQTGASANERNLRTLLSEIHQITDSSQPRDIVPILENLRNAGEARIQGNSADFPNHRTSTAITLGSTLDQTLTDAQVEAIRVGMVHQFSERHQDPTRYEEGLSEAREAPAAPRAGQTTRPRTTLDDADRAIFNRIQPSLRETRDLEALDNSTLNQVRNSLAEETRERLNRGESADVATMNLISRLDAVLLRKDIALRASAAMRARLEREGIVVSAADIERGILSHMSFVAGGGVMLEGPDLLNANITGGAGGIGIIIRPFTVTDRSGRGTVSIAEFGGAVGISSNGPGAGLMLNLVNAQYRIGANTTLEAGTPIGLDPFTLSVGASAYIGVRQGISSRWDLAARASIGGQIGVGVSPSFGAMLGIEFNPARAYESARQRMIDSMNLMAPDVATIPTMRARVIAITGLPESQFANNDAEVRAVYGQIWESVHTNAARESIRNGLTGAGVAFGIIRDNRGQVIGFGPYVQFTVGSHMVYRFSPDNPVATAQRVHDLNTEAIRRLRNPNNQRVIGTSTVRGEAALRVTQVGVASDGHYRRTVSEAGPVPAAVQTDNPADTTATVRSFLQEISGIRLAGNRINIANPSANTEYRIVSMVPGITVNASADNSTGQLDINANTFNVVRRMVIHGPAVTGGEHSNVEVIAFLPSTMTDAEFQAKMAEVTEMPRDYVAVTFAAGSTVARFENRHPSTTATSAIQREIGTEAATQDPTVRVTEQQLDTLLGARINEQESAADRALLDRVFREFASTEAGIVGFRTRANILSSRHRVGTDGNFDTVAYYNGLIRYVQDQMRSRLGPNEHFSEQMNWGSVLSMLTAAANVSNIRNLSPERQVVAIDHRIDAVENDPISLMRDRRSGTVTRAEQAGIRADLEEVRRDLHAQGTTIHVGPEGSGHEIPQGHVVRVQASANRGDNRSVARQPVTSRDESFRAVARHEHNMHDPQHPERLAGRQAIFDSLINDRFVEQHIGDFFLRTLSEADRTAFNRISAANTPADQMSAEDRALMTRLRTELRTLAADMRTRARNGETTYTFTRDGHTYPVSMHATVAYSIHAGGTTHQSNIGNCGNVLVDAHFQASSPGTTAVSEQRMGGVRDAIVLGTNTQGRRSPGLTFSLGFAVGYRESDEGPGHTNARDPGIPRRNIPDQEHPNARDPGIPQRN